MNYLNNYNKTNCLCTFNCLDNKLFNYKFDNNQNGGFKNNDSILINLLNNKDWDSIIDLYKNPRDIQINGNNLLHLACSRGETKAINYYLSKFPELFYVSNSYGDTCAHILSKYAHFDILKKYLKLFPEVIQFINHDKYTILDINIPNFDIFNFILDLIEPSYFNNKNFKINCFITIFELIKLNNNNNDKYFQAINNFISKGLIYDLDNDIYDPLYYASKLNKFNIVKLLLINKFDPNIKNIRELTSLIIAVVNNSYESVELLLEYNADINYSGPEGDDLPINIALSNKDNKMINILLNSKYTKIDYSIKNRYLNTPLHIALYINIDDFFISKSNLNIMIKNTDLSIQNLYNKSVYDLLKIFSDKHKIKFNLKKNKKLKNKTKQNIIMPKIKESNYTIFISDFLNNTIYFYCLIKKYKNINIPIKNLEINDFKSEYLNFKFLSNFRSKEGNIIKFIVNNYYTNLYNILPYLILWRSKDLYYINNHIKESVNNLLLDNHIDFIVLKLSILSDNDSTHANILIYNKNKNILERFEPYGNNIILDNNNELDIFIYELAKDIFNKNIIYITPKDFLTNAKFQIISGDSIYDNKNYSDSDGFCLAWIFWFLELRITNPNTNSKILVDTALQNIYSKNKNDSNIVLDYIRNYSFKLINIKNNFLKSCDIPESDYYNNKFTDNQYKAIYNKLIF